MPLAFNKVTLNAITYVCLNPSNAASGQVSLYLELPLGEFAWVTVTSSTTPPTDDTKSVLIGTQLGGFAHRGTVGDFFAGETGTYFHAKAASAGYTGKAGIALA